MFVFKVVKIKFCELFYSIHFGFTLYGISFAPYFKEGVASYSVLKPNILQKIAQ